MKVILQERVINLGDVGEQVNVRPGFVRNYLLPRGKAVQATQANIIAFEKCRAELEKKAADALLVAQKRAIEFENFTVTLSAQASEEGKLFGSIGPRDIAKAVSDTGKHLEKSEVEMPEGPIRTIGEYLVTVFLHGEVHSKITVIVNAA